MPTAFVTGGTGFIGSHLVEALLARGYDEVRCLVRSSLKWLDGLAVEVVEGDLFDDEALRAGVRDVDYVFHAAGVTRARSWETFEKGNVTGTLNLLRAVREANEGVRKVLVTSSLAAVGACEGGVATEETPLAPVSNYGRSKAAMERALRRPAPEGTMYAEQLPIAVVRPPAVYGPRETDIFTFFKTVSRGVCPIVGRGTDPALSLVHVRDLVRGMVDVAEAEATRGKTYFIGSEEVYTWNQVKQATTAALGRGALTLPIPSALVEPVGAIVEVAARLVGQYPPLNREKAREIVKTCKVCTVDRVKRDVGYRQRVALEAGIAETIDWYREHGWL